MKQLSAVIVDDHKLFSHGFACLVSKDKELDIKVQAHLYDLTSAKTYLSKHIVDILFVDLNLPDGDGIDLISKHSKRYPDTKIIVLTMYSDKRLAKKALKKGAKAFLLKSCTTEEMTTAILTVIQKKECYTDASITFGSSPQKNKYVDIFAHKHRLTQREVEVLQLITQALTNKEIADQLYISDQTVSVHRKNIMRKLGVSNTAGLVKMAYVHSLI